MNTEHLTAVMAQYQQWLADAQLQLAVALAEIAALKAPTADA